HSIEREYVIVNNKVYNYFSKLIIESPKVYHLSLKLEDGTNLDGMDKLTTMSERGNKRKLFNNLQYQARNYYKHKKIEPAQECINVEKTNEYQETKKSIQKILESL
ncbi:hypothetical protein, partial [Paraburkholderia sp. BR14264]|uniref:hypothetical protein n=1 Tax=Paraburkholderia sp. BR14264 TaxID=3237001 RepID=UPI00397DE6FF